MSKQAERNLPVILHVSVCAVNDFLRRPALCGPPCLRPARNKKRVVRVGEQLRWRAKGRGSRKGGIWDIENKQRHIVQRPARTPTHPPPEIPSTLVLTFLFLSLVCLLLYLPSLLSFLPLFFLLSITVHISLSLSLWFSGSPYPSFSSLCENCNSGLRSLSLFISQTDMKAKQLSMSLCHSHAIMCAETSYYSQHYWF